MQTFSVHGELGGEISIEIVEELHEAALDGVDGLEAWREGKAFHLIPPEEEESRSRYENDPIKKGVPCGQFRKGIHFGEINVMRRLLGDEFRDGLYEVYELFNPPPQDATSRTAVRTQIAAAALGPEVVLRLRDAARIYQAGRVPSTPDLMAWKEHGGTKEFRFIESKNERKTERGYYVEGVKPNQLLGLALIALCVPGSTVHIYRWLGSDLYRSLARTFQPRKHRRTFRPNGST